MVDSVLLFFTFKCKSIKKVPVEKIQYNYAFIYFSFVPMAYNGNNFYEMYEIILQIVKSNRILFVCRWQFKYFKH